MQKNSGLVILCEQLLRLAKQLRSRRTPITSSKPECLGFLQGDSAQIKERRKKVGVLRLRPTIRNRIISLSSG
jgi:hypothetical protein